MDTVSEFSPNSTIGGVYNITWTPPPPSNGSFYQILYYSYSSAYTVGPSYSGNFTSEQLNQDQSYYTFDALYFTNYNFTITTINMKYNIDSGPVQSSNQSSPTGKINFGWQKCFMNEL